MLKVDLVLPHHFHRRLTSWEVRLEPTVLESVRLAWHVQSGLGEQQPVRAGQTYSG